MLITYLNVKFPLTKGGKDERGDGAQTQERGALIKLDNPRDFGGRGHRGEGFLLG